MGGIEVAVRRIGSLSRRAAAGSIDLVLVLLLTGLLAPSTGRWCAERAALALRVGEESGAWKGALPMVLGMVGELSYGWPVPVILALTLPRAILGRSPGEVWLGVPSRAMLPARSRPRRALWVTAPAIAFLTAWAVGTPAAAIAAAALSVLWCCRRFFESKAPAPREPEGRRWT